MADTVVTLLHNSLLEQEDRQSNQILSSRLAICRWLQAGKV